MNEYTVYYKDTANIVLEKYNSNIDIVDLSDTIERLKLKGYLFYRKYHDLKESNNDNEVFKQKVRKIGGYVYCY